MSKKLLSQRNKFFYFLAIWYRRLIRYSKWYFDSNTHAKKKQTDKLPYRVKKHQSVLVRKLGDSEMILQYNKVTNLEIAIKKLNGIIIGPNEVLSLCRIIGLPTKGKGYLPGMELYNEELPYSYHVYEKDHEFLKIEDEFFRKNEIWRNKILEFESGKILETELLIKNFSKVKYIPECFKEINNVYIQGGSKVG